MKNSILGIILISIFIYASKIDCYSVHENSFELHENSTTVEAFKIKVITKSQKSDLPKTIEFHLNVLGQDRKIRLDRVSIKSKRHPISSRDVYKLDLKTNRFVRNTQVDNDNQIDHAFYHDRQDTCVSTVYKNEDKSLRLLGTCHFDGHVYTIVPIQFSNDRRKKRNTKQIKLNPHGVVKRSIATDKTIDYIKLAEPNNPKVVVEEVHQRKKRQSSALNAVVEVLVVIDYSTYLDHKRLTGIQDEKTLINYLKVYFAHLMNGVNLIYLNSFSDDSELKVSIKLKNFLIATENQESTWSNRDNVGVAGYETFKNREVIEADATLKALAEFISNKDLKFEVDHAAGFSTKDFFSGSKNLDADQRSMVAGLAYMSSTCKKKVKYSINEDRGLFDGILTTAHEIGHNLGSDHDGESPNTDCPTDWGYVMTPVQKSGPNSFKFSQCSIRSIKKYIISNGAFSSDATCLSTTSSESVPEESFVKDSYPGQFYTPEDQCKNAYTKEASFCGNYNDKICTSLYCRTSMKSQVCSSLGGAAQGTVCDKGKMCIKGECVENAKAPQNECPFGDDASIRIYSNYEPMPCEDYLEMRIGKLGKNDCKTLSSVQKRCCLSCRVYGLIDSCADAYSNCEDIKGDCSSAETRKDCPKACKLCNLKVTCGSGSNLCLNGGTCRNVANDKVRGFECDCATGYQGKYCEEKNPCEPNPCTDGKKCILIGTRGYFCS